MSSDPNKKVKLLFTCLDWRLHPQIENAFIGGDNMCDLCVTAGSIKGLLDPATRDYFLEQIDISRRLHNCQAVILTMHIDCGAYGGSKPFGAADNEMAHHRTELMQAQSIVASKFPGLAIEKYVIGLEKKDQGWVIDLKQVS